MLFLVRSEATVPASTTMEEVAPLLEQTWEMLARYQREGKIVAGGRVAGTRFAYFVVDADSADQLDEMFANSPLYSYVDLEIMPLTSIERSLQRIKEWVRGHPESQSGPGEQTGPQSQWPAS